MMPLGLENSRHNLGDGRGLPYRIGRRISRQNTAKMVIPATNAKLPPTDPNISVSQPIDRRALSGSVGPAITVNMLPPSS